MELEKCKMCVCVCVCVCVCARIDIWESKRHGRYVRAWHIVVAVSESICGRGSHKMYDHREIVVVKESILFLH